MHRQRIVAVITHNDQGGAQEALCRLCKELANRGHSVKIWYLYKKQESVDPGVPYQFVIDRDACSLKDYASISFSLAKGLSRERPNVLLSFLPLANVLTQTLGWFFGIPIRIASQRNPVQTYSRAMKALDWYFGTVGCYTDNVVNSSDVNNSVQGYPWPYRYRTRIIHNGIDPRTSRNVDRSHARSQFDLDANETALVSVGRLSKQKNQSFLIQILGALSGFKLLLAGEGPEHERLRTEAERMGVADRVIFLGSLKQSDTQQLLWAADIFALPSLYEGQSNALLEAMLSGRAIITSDIPSHRETLVDKQMEAGIVLPTSKPDVWISTLSELADSEHKREKLGKLAQQRVKAFTLERMCLAFESTMESTRLRTTSKRRYLPSRASFGKAARHS